MPHGGVKMGYTYHKNAKTTVIMRKLIIESAEPMEMLAEHLKLNKNTICKWKNRKDEHEDKSSRPHKLRTILSELEEWIICEVRLSTGFSIDNMVNALEEFIPKTNRDNIYRCLKRNGIFEIEKQKSEATKEKKEVGKFEDYIPGYIHVDIKLMPKLKSENEKGHLYAAIDRATRMVYMSLKTNKSAEKSVEFLEEIIRFFPYNIHRILTDNGKEFTDRYARGKKEASGNHLFDKKCMKEGIKHKLAKPYTPQTNGMVERFNGRVQEILDKKHFEDYNNLMICLKEYERLYNFNIRQKVLGNIPPIGKAMEWYEKQSDIFKREDVLSYNLSQPDT